MSKPAETKDCALCDAENDKRKGLKGSKLMRERLIELLKNVPKNTRVFYDQYADWLLANGVIVPPCKVGEHACVLKPSIEPYTMSYGYVNEIKLQYKTTLIELYLEPDTYECFYPEEIGKTLFIGDNADEEAEQALRKGDKWK